MAAMEIERVAEAAVSLGWLTVAFTRVCDGAGWGVSVACGLMPLVAFAVRGCESYEGCDAAAVWLFASLVFVVTFCRIMLGVKNTVGAEDLQRLVTDTTSILTSGIAAANCIFLLPRCPTDTLAAALLLTLATSLLLLALRGSGAPDLPSGLASSAAAVLQGLAFGHGVPLTASSILAVAVATSLELPAGARPSASQSVVIVARAALFSLCSLHYLHD